MVINEIKRVKNGYHLAIDNETVHIETSVMVDYKLKKNQVLSLKQFREIIEQNELAKIKRQAVVYVAKARSVHTFKEYLRGLNAKKEYIEELTKQFKEKGYLNDTSYATDFVHRYEKKYGQKRLRMMLVEKGIHPEIIDKVLKDHTDINLESQIQTACLTVKADNTEKAKVKITRKMASLGYDLTQISIYIDKYLDASKFKESETIEKYYKMALKKYQHKYAGYELQTKIKKYLYEQGYSFELIDKII